MKAPDPSATKNNSVIWPELWSAFSAHRQEITKLLTSIAPRRNGSLAVWGAGRTTDLDLISLQQQYATIDLLDLEPSITREAMTQRGFDDQHNVTVQQAMDLSGLNEHWDQFRPRPSESSLEKIREACGNVELQLGQYDVVASTCLLSQILRQWYDCMKESGISLADESLYGTLRTIRERHIELLLEHTAPGGTALLISDMTTSEALPAMLQGNADLSELVKNDVVRGNHLHGLNPQMIAEFARTPKITSMLRGFQVSAPWVWNSIEMQYLCLAFKFDKK